MKAQNQRPQKFNSRNFDYFGHMFWLGQDLRSFFIFYYVLESEWLHEPQLSNLLFDKLQQIPFA